jgi:MinD-like ATPase involved in chromosome partitioning or flagellar assembly
MSNNPPMSFEDELPRPSGRIITFYSYKGGTGRSMALANVAWILASNKKRVLVIDWDFEAPGLHRYFRPFLSDQELTETPGLIDCFVHFVEAACVEGRSSTQATGQGRQWFNERANLLRYSVSLNHDFGDGTLDLVAAGQQSASYASRVNSFQWRDFYEKLGGGIFLEAMKAQLREQYDYVLIDSRTGLSDTSGICTVQMPDELVVCFTLNRQSIVGAAATAESADAQRRLSTGQQGLRIWPVPTRVELYEKNRLEAARLLAKEKFAPFLWHIPLRERVEYWGGTEVPYFPYYAYEEVLATVADAPKQSNSLLNSMERLTARLTRGEIASMPVLNSGVREELLSKYEPARSSKTVPAKRTPQFYISYSKADGLLPIVRKLGNALEKRFGKASAFWDERVPLGQNWSQALEKSLGDAAMLLVLIGPAWRRSGYAQQEVNQALAQHKPIVPLLVNNAEWADVPVPLKDFRGVELKTEDMGAMDELIETLANSPLTTADEPAAFVDVDDPQLGRWGGRAENDSPGRRLEARVTEGQNGWFKVALAVHATGKVPLTDTVEFHLHPTFRPSVAQVSVRDGKAEIEMSAWGAFTVGASADGGATRLELNLAELVDAPELFKQR